MTTKKKHYIGVRVDEQTWQEIQKSPLNTTDYVLTALAYYQNNKHIALQQLNNAKQRLHHQLTMIGQELQEIEKQEQNLQTVQLPEIDPTERLNTELKQMLVGIYDYKGNIPEQQINYIAKKHQLAPITIKTWIHKNLENNDGSVLE